MENSKEITTVAEIYRICRPIISNKYGSEAPFERKFKETGGKKGWKHVMSWPSEGNCIEIWWNGAQYHMIVDRKDKLKTIFKERIEWMEEEKFENLLKD